VTEAENISNVPNLYDLNYMDLVHAINQSLKAHFLFKRDVDYMVKDGQVIIVDEFTGRLIAGAVTATACTRPWKPRSGSR